MYVEKEVTPHQADLLHLHPEMHVQAHENESMVLSHAVVNGESYVAIQRVLIYILLTLA